jgi:hypothetical protein
LGGDTGLKSSVEDFKGHPPLGPESVPGRAGIASAGSGIRVWIGRDIHIPAHTQDSGVFNVPAGSGASASRESIEVIATGATDELGAVQFSHLVRPDTYWLVAKQDSRSWRPRQFRAGPESGLPAILDQVVWNREWPYPVPECQYVFVGLR